MLKCLFKRAWRTFVHSMLCTYGAMSTYYTFVRKNRRSGCLILFCSFKNVFYIVNTSLACLINIRQWQAGACLCMNWRMDIICILMFFCSYVLITCYILLVETWDPWSWPGMTMLVDIAFGGCILFKRQRNKRTKEFIECANVCSN